MSFDLCYVISHGFAARMLFQTGLINQLTERGLKVAIITPDPEDDNLQAFQDNANIQIFGSSDKQNIWDDDYNFKRKYYLEDIKSNPALWEKHVYSLFYSPSKHPWKRVRPLFYYLAYAAIKVFPSIRHRFEKKENQYLKSDTAKKLVEKINPRLVVATYPVNLLEAKTLFAAKAKKIPTLLHLLSWDNITSKGRFPVAPDYFIAWGPIMYEELKAHYQTPDQRVFICGVPHFDHHIKIKEQNNYTAKLSKLGLAPDRPYLFVAMSAPRFAPREIDIVEWLAKNIEADVFGKDLQLVVRPHPQNVQGSMSKASWLKRLDQLQSKRVAIDYPRLVKSKIKWSMQKEDMDHLSNLLAGCSLCINSGSTVSIDALMLDKPVILTSFDGSDQLSYWKSARRLIDYTHLKKLVSLGGVQVARSYTDFQNKIQAYLSDPLLHMDERKATLTQQCFKNDGRSTERVVEAVQEILQDIKTNAKQPTADAS